MWVRKCYEAKSPWKFSNSNYAGSKGCWLHREWKWRKLIQWWSVKKENGMKMIMLMHVRSEVLYWLGFMILRGGLISLPFQFFFISISSQIQIFEWVFEKGRLRCLMGRACHYYFSHLCFSHAFNQIPKIPRVFPRFLGGKMHFSSIQIIKPKNIAALDFIIRIPPYTSYFEVCIEDVRIIKSENVCCFELYTLLCQKSMGKKQIWLYNMNYISTKQRRSQKFFGVWAQ